MREFKFLNKPRREVLDVIFTQNDLTLIKNYCVDFVNRHVNNIDIDLLNYYRWIGIIEKTFSNGVLSNITINYFRSSGRCTIKIEILGNNPSCFIVKSVAKFSPYNNFSAAHFYPDEEL
jgi:hypothetical protein